MHRGAQKSDVVEGCFQNIGVRGRRRRLRGFLMSAGGAAALWLLLALSHARGAAFLSLAPLVAAASLYYFQAREMTCVVLAATGKRERDAPPPTRAAGEWLVAIRRQARKVWLETLATTAAVTAAGVGVGLLIR